MSRDPTFENALAFARDLIRIPSPPGREEEVARRVVEEMEALGYDEVEVDDAGNAVGVIRGEGGAPPVMLSCHLDVVAEGDPEEWEYPPYEGVVKDGFLHGRGAMDIKGPLALQTYAAAAVRNEGGLPGDVIVAHTVLEERGGLGMQWLLETGGVTPGAVIIGEATRGDVCIGHRGRGEIEVVLHGVAGHASAPERARNALDLLPHVLGAISDLAAMQAEATDPVLGPATVVATGVEDVLPESRNVIPDRAVVAVDWRVLPGTTEEAMIRSVEDALERRLPDPPEKMSLEVRFSRERQRTWTGIEEERALFTPGFLLEPGHPVVRAAARAVGSREDADEPARVRPWTFATDGGWACGVHGIPTVGFAPGEERYAHTNVERLGLEEGQWVLGRYPELIRAVMGALVEG